MLKFIKSELIDHWVVLCNYIAQGRNDSEGRSFEFVEKVVELAIKMLLFVSFFEDCQLKFAHYRIPKEEVDENIIVFSVQSVFDFDYFQEKRVGFLDFVQVGQDVDELMLQADVASPQEVSYIEVDKIDFIQILFLGFCSDQIFTVNSIMLVNPLARLKSD